MSGYKNFNRYKVFNDEDRTLVLDCIKETDRYNYENGGAELCNMLFGLFDGYYYDKLDSYATEWLPDNKLEQLRALLAKIDNTFIHVMNYNTVVG